MVFYKLLGSLWILLGLLWLLKPEALRNRLKKKMSRKIRWIAYGFIVMFGLSLAGGIVRAQGFLPKIIGLIGIIVTIKGILLLMSKTSEKISSWWAEKPIIFFRMWALFILAAGLMLIFA